MSESAAFDRVGTPHCVTCLGAVENESVYMTTVSTTPTPVSTTPATWTCLGATWSSDDARRRRVDDGDDGGGDTDDGRLELTLNGLLTRADFARPRDIGRFGSVMANAGKTTTMESSLANGGDDAAMRSATRRVLREFGDANEEDAGARLDATLDELAAALRECAEKAVLPRKSDAVIRSREAAANCGAAVETAMRRDAPRTLARDAGETLATATKNADVARAYYEAIACVRGAKDEDTLEVFRALSSVRVFDGGSKPTALAVMDVFAGLFATTSDERVERVVECLEASGALRDFVSQGFVAMAASQQGEGEGDAGSSVDGAMAKRFFAFVLNALRSDRRGYARQAFAGVESAAVPVVQQLCLARAASDPGASELYQEISKRL